MSRMRELPPSESERIAAQEEARRKYAPYLGMFLEEIGNVSISRGVKHWRKGDEEYNNIQISPAIRIASTDGNFVASIYQLLGGRMNERVFKSQEKQYQWSMSGYDASSFAEILIRYTPSREQQLRVMAEWAFSNDTEYREEIHKAFRDTPRSPVSVEQYTLLLKDPIALAGAVEVTKKIEKRTGNREDRLSLQTNNLELLTALGNLCGLQPKVFQEAGRNIARAGKEYTTINPTYIIRLPSEEEHRLLETIAFSRPPSIIQEQNLINMG